jgi:hypothetical protein
MTTIFETKVAACADIDQRLETLSHALRAFVDCWAPRIQALHSRKDRALGSLDKELSEAARNLQRAVVEAQYDAMLDELTREGKSHRKALDRMFDFYTDQDIDPEERTLH